MPGEGLIKPYLSLSNYEQFMVVGGEGVPVFSVELPLTDCLYSRQLPPFPKILISNHNTESHRKQNTPKDIKFSVGFGRNRRILVGEKDERKGWA